MNKLFKILIGIGVIASGFAISGLLWITRPGPDKVEKAKALMAVDYIRAEFKTVSFEIPTQGIVEAHRRSLLAAEVPGKVIYVDPLFDVGQIVPANHTLIRLDDTDFEAAIAQAEANLAETESALRSEEARRDQARRDWERDPGSNKDFDEAPPLVQRIPQLKSAMARVNSAMKALKKARQDKERTEIKVPFSCIIASKNTELGSYVSPGFMVAEVFDSGSYEVRLPVSIDELTHLKFNEDGDPTGVVRLKATVGSDELSWEAEITRSEGEIDRQTRSLYLVVRVENAQGVKIRPGLFVTASISGKPYKDVAAIPFQAFTTLNQIVVIKKENGEDKLYPRDVEILYQKGNTVFVESGLNHGDRICVTEVPDLVSGLPVKVTPLSNKKTSEELSDNTTATN